MTDLSTIPTEALEAEIDRRKPEKLAIAYFGNFDPPHSTENEYVKAWRANGHGVTCWREQHMPGFDKIEPEDFDLIVWTRTVWPDMDFGAMARMLKRAWEQKVPVVGVHLDIWWGLARQEEIDRHPWFGCDLLFTADGGHEDEWASAGIQHEWLPPGVSEFECVPIDPAPEYAADVAFVGGWQPGYHAESRHRGELIAHLRSRGDVRFFPPKGQHAIRGENLRKLYATTKVNVGDSCFAGTGLAKYLSDRTPETLGRGGFLLHPHTQGVTDGTLYTDGEHLRCYEPFNWAELDKLIDYYLTHEDERRQIAEQGRTHVLRNHTYTVRVQEIITRLRARGML